MPNNFDNSVKAFEDRGFPLHEARQQAKDAQEIQKKLKAGESIFSITKEIQNAVSNVNPKGFCNADTL